jgi:hypothetical protein
VLLRTTLSPELWWREKVDELLRRDQVPADCVSDLPTKRNALSVYEVADEDAAERVVAALALQKAIGGATQKQSLRDMSGLMFDARLLANLGIATKRIKGNTPDQTVNDWYLDLIDLTGSQLVELAKVLLQNTEPVTFFHPKLLKRVKAGVEEGLIQAALPQRVKEQLADIP